MLVLDDLHAADEPSLLLLQFVARELGESRLLIVGAYRDVDPTLSDPLTTTLAELAREPVTRTLALAGLGEADVARFIELAAPGASAAELGAGGARRDRGQPSLRRRDCAAARRGEATGRAGDGAACDPREREGGDRPPSAPPLGRLQPAAHPGLGARPRVRSRCAGGCQRSRVAAPSSSCSTRRSRRASSRRFPALIGRMRFAHALIRDAAYHRLTRSRRVQLHRQVGEALEALYSSDLDAHLAELAYHFFESAAGGDGEKAVDYARRAGARAVALLAYEEAARLYKMALEALGLDAAATAELRCELLLALADAQGRAGDDPAAKSTFLRAADLARSAQLAEMLARAAAGYGGRFLWAHALATSGSSRCSRTGSPRWERPTACCGSSCSRAWPRRCATDPHASVASEYPRRPSRSRAGSATPQRSPMRSSPRRPPCTDPTTPTGGWPKGKRSSHS